jgi:stage II sporulation protein E
MQYGAELYPYERAQKLRREDNKNKKANLTRLISTGTYFIFALLISRVVMVNYMAPFGMAFLVAIMVEEEENLYIAAGCGTILGYASLYGSALKAKFGESVGAYFIAICTIVILGYITKGRIKKHRRLALYTTVIFLEILGYKCFIGLSMNMSVITSLFEIGCILPIYFITDYSIICFKDIRVRHIFSSEEVISMAITASLIVAGTWGVSIYGIQIRNILALAAVAVLGYVKGAEAGAAGGVALGTIMGITSSNLIVFIAVYSLCGLITGVFHETGKFWSGITFMVAFSIIKLYSNLGGDFKIMEALLSLVIFLIIPVSQYEKLEADLDFNNVHSDLKDDYANKIKDILMDKVKDFSDVLNNVSSALDKLVDNEKLEMSSKCTYMVENLADRVCSTCNMNSMCWKRESYYTYNAFTEMIQNYQEKKDKIPYEIERKCVKKNALVKNAEDLVNKYIVNEIWRSKSIDCRKMLSGQIYRMASSVSNIVEDISCNIKFNKDIENKIRRVLRKMHVPYVDVVTFYNKRGKLIVKLTMESCGGTHVCIKEVLPLLNEVTEKCMCVAEDEECHIDDHTGYCTITFEETPQFYVATYVSKACKDGEQESGDSFNFGKLQDESYMLVLSDGMGSGPRAQVESGATVNLIKKFASSGFDRINSISMVNSILSLKFSEDEKFSTVDLSSIDLYSGEASFIKIGSAASFIKSGSDVEVISSKTLPIGVVDSLEVETVDKRLTNGDMIIMMSDGVIDCDSSKIGKPEWMAGYLEELNCNDPKELSAKLLEKAKEVGEGKVKDDMTIMVSKIYSLY